MRSTGPRLVCDHITVALDLAAREHQVVIIDGTGRRLTRFCIGHSRVGIAELLRRSRPERWNAADRQFAFEATGHVWEALACHLEAAGERYVIVNPLATFRLREARSMDRTKTDRTDAEQIAPAGAHRHGDLHAAAVGSLSGATPCLG